MYVVSDSFIVKVRTKLTYLTEHCIFHISYAVHTVVISTIYQLTCMESAHKTPSVGQQNDSVALV